MLQYCPHLPWFEYYRNNLSNDVLIFCYCHQLNTYHGIFIIDSMIWHIFFSLSSTCCWLWQFLKEGKYGKHTLWISGNNGLPHMVSESIYIYIYSYPLYLFQVKADWFLIFIINIWVNLHNTYCIHKWLITHIFCCGWDSLDL